MMRFSRTSVLAAALLAAAIVLAADASSASAGIYTVTSCHTDTGKVNNAWTYETTKPSAFIFANNCSNGEGALLPSGVDTRNSLVLQSQLGLHGSGSQAALVFAAPLGTTTTQISYDRQLQVFNSDFWTSRLQTAEATIESCKLSPGWSVCTLAGIGFFGSLHSPVLRLELVDSSNQGSGGGTSSSASAVIREISVQITDNTLPAANTLSGSLVGASNVTSGGTVTVGGSDSTGIKRVEVLLDGQLVDSTANVCNYTYRAPCALTSTSFSSTFNVGTAALAAGSHTLTGRVVDAAENVATRTATFQVAAATTTPPVTSTPPTPKPPTTTPPAAKAATTQSAALKLTSVRLTGKKATVKGTIKKAAKGTVRVKLTWRDAKTKKNRSKTYTAKRSGSKWSLSRAFKPKKAKVSVTFKAKAPWKSATVTKNIR